MTSGIRAVRVDWVGVVTFVKDKGVFRAELKTDSDQSGAFTGYGWPSPGSKRSYWVALIDGLRSWLKDALVDEGLAWDGDPY